MVVGTAALFTSVLLDDIRRKLAQGQRAAVERIEIDGITLSAALELACIGSAWRAAGDALGLSLFDRWCDRAPRLAEASSAIDGARSTHAPTFAAPEVELHGVRTRDDLLDTRWDLYRQRFNRSLQAHGFSTTIATGLSKAFAEMADNIAQHSPSSDDDPLRGVVGYHVANRWATFAVVDLGRGVLASIRTKPAWSHLTAAADALERTVMEGETRRPDAAKGSGFKQVHKAMVADLNARLRFRSDDAVLLLGGRGGALAGRRLSNPPLHGFQMSVTCALDPEPPELPAP